MDVFSDLWVRISFVDLIFWILSIDTSAMLNLLGCRLGVGMAANECKCGWEQNKPEGIIT